MCAEMRINMDIPSLSMSLAQSQVLTDVGTALLSKSIDQAQLMGDSLTEMLDSAAMELSVNPDIGSNIDIRI